MDWSQTKQASTASKKPIRGKVKSETVDNVSNFVMLNVDAYSSSVSPLYHSH